MSQLEVINITLFEYYLMNDFLENKKLMKAFTGDKCCYDL